MINFAFRFMVLALALAVGANARAANPTPGLPPAGEDSFPVAAAITITNANGFPCSLLLTGPALVKRGTPIPGSQVIITTTLESMELTGQNTDLGGTVRLLAGSNLVGRATTGQIKGISPGTTASSFLDVFFKIELPGGTHLFNTNSVRLTTTIAKVSQLDVTYTNTSSLALLETDGATTNASGNLIRFWFIPSRSGKEMRLGLSQDVVGDVVPGTVSSAVCSGSNVLSSVTTTVRGQSILGSITANTACDQLGLGGTNIFEAVWDSAYTTNLWRGSHTGSFRILQVSGSATNVFATGTMDGNNGVGTHRSPLPDDCEECGPCNQFEGRLSGKIVADGNLKGGAIEAGYAGQFIDTNGVPIACSPLPADPPSGLFRMSIDGVAIVKGCLPVGGSNVASATASSSLPDLRVAKSTSPLKNSGARLALSSSVSGTSTLGVLSTGVCTDTNDIASAVVSVQDQLLTGTATLNTNCDQLAVAVPTNLLASTTLRMAWDSNLRAPDWRGNHRGTFVLVKGNTIIAKGTLDGINGVGTHRLPALTNDCEACESCGHFEGKLRGKFVSPSEFKGALLDATYTGQFVDSQTNSISCCPPPNHPPSGAFRMAIDGLVITRDCIPQ